MTSDTEKKIAELESQIAELDTEMRAAFARIEEIVREQQRIEQQIKVLEDQESEDDPER
jgi:septal ring factor EnvC (AmiA/AmiB activator)